MKVFDITEDLAARKSQVVCRVALGIVSSRAMRHRPFESSYTIARDRFAQSNFSEASY